MLSCPPPVVVAGSHATGDALLCRRMFDKEIFFRTSGASVRRAADVEKTAQETLAQQRIFFV